MEIYGAAMVAVAVFTVPGFLLSWVSGLKAPWAAAASVPVSFGVFGFAAWFYGMTRFAFNSVSVSLLFLVALAVAGLWRFGAIAYRRRARNKVVPEVPDPTKPMVVAPKPRFGEGWREGSVIDPRWVLPGVGALVGAWMFMSRSLELLNNTRYGMENIYQGWDVHWHASVIRFILETGVADPTRMGELQNLESKAQLYYPSAWHAGAFLVAERAEISPIAATNITAIVIPALVLPLSVGLLSWRIVSNRGLTAQIAAGLSAIAVYASPVLYWIGHYVGAWPYVAAVSMAGIVWALFMSVPAVKIRAFAAAASFIGMVQTHPSAATIVVLGLVCWWLFWLVWVPSRRPETQKQQWTYRLADIGVLAATGGGAVAIFLPQLLAGAGQSEEVKSFTATENVSRHESWWMAIEMMTRHTDAAPNSPWVLWVAGAGAIVALLWRRNIWLPVCYAISVWITVNSLRPFGDGWGEWLETIGALHYNTAHRLIMPVAMITFAYIGVAIAVAIRLICLGPIARFRTASVVVSTVLALVSGLYLMNRVTSEMQEGSEWAMTAARDARMVGEIDLKAYRWLARQPFAYDGLILSNPAEGSGWAYPYNNLPMLFPHYLWPATGIHSATNMVYWHPDKFGVGANDDPDELNVADIAARRLNINYIIVSPPSFWAFQEPLLPMEQGLWSTPGVTPVYKDRHVVIFAINDRFTDAQLLKMREPGNSPERLPDLPTKGQKDKAKNPDEYDQPYFHRPTKAPSAPLNLNEINDHWQE
ncbi:DUF6541 family protein [Corynebacterium freiburgense]|uniref:DUF6541 family protein n=1 Tax=Corynebacterium freiburgense TaxID=556548 RepID=UPI0003FE15AA|nr:DUF6541 family protein [Corynebacterium freiburgense]WJZ01698.1 hypothetical protein CFREI_01970 [Corynebacterium freiburgense]